MNILFYFIITTTGPPAPILPIMQVELKNCVEKAGSVFSVPQCENVFF